MPSFDEKVFLERDNDTGDKWAWQDEDKAKWEAVTSHDMHQEFCDWWYGEPNDLAPPSSYPYVLRLGLPTDRSTLPFGPENISDNQILVTESYELMFLRLLHLRESDKGQTRGAVLTGQPGIGKTTFLNFVLAQLVSTRQVVLLCNSIDAHLFYRGKVYHRLATSGFKHLPERVNPPESSDLPERSDSDLPKRSNRRYFPIWTLVDVDNKPQGLNIPKKSNIWPVQASSPNPIRWKAWGTHYGAAVLGMPLWDMKELMEGFRLRPAYDDFKTKLQGFLPLPVGPTPPTSDDRTIDAALKVLHTEAVRQQTLVTQADSALEILMHNATEEFGFAPHDAYGGIIDFPTTKGTHATTLEILDCSRLKTFVNGFSERETFHQFSHRVVTVWPRQTSGKHDDWEIGFKSSRIEKGVMERMLSEEDKYLWETLDFFYKIRVGAYFAGCIFEALVHRLLSHCWLSDPVHTPRPIRMKSNDHKPPTFSTPDTPQSSPEPQPIRTVSNNGEPPTSRAVTLVKSPDLSNVTLDKDKYYITSALNCPLFDSFIIDHDHGQQTTAISVFQVAMSSTHGGSPDGYGDIRKIMARVCDLLENPNAQVKVVYFLVCPEDGLTRRWQMPTGWAEDAVVHNHPGEVFCIRIPSSERSGFS